MNLPQTRALLPRVEWRESSTSTNFDLRELLDAAGDLPHGTLLATANQTAGRGRLGRSWETPSGTALAASLLVRYEEEHAQRGGGRLGASWLPLLTGSAVSSALRPFFGEEQRVGVKWPNDVHVRGENDAVAGSPGVKLSGILCEMIPGAKRAPGDPRAVASTPVVIVGFGVNLLQQDWQLPTERAGSVLESGGDIGNAQSLDDASGMELADRVLSTACTELLALLELARDRPDAARRRVLRDSLTLGSEVRVHLPGGEQIDGRAVALDADGALVVDRPTGGQLIVNAADVEHLR